MPVLDWIGKRQVINHDKEVPFRLLKRVDSLSVGKSENLIIKGDNLEALKALLPYYYNKVKCIYIDPPYNTGNEDWVYNDKVNSPEIKKWLGKVVGSEGEDLSRHDKWLCMMYPRLKLLRELLAENGVIFISIDDNEHCNLRQIMDEIFGENNFLANLVWHLGTGTTAGQFARSHEYIMCFAKNIEKISNFKNPLEDETIRHGALKKHSYKNPMSEIEFPAGMDFEGNNAIFKGTIGGSEKMEIKGEMIFKDGK